MSEQDLSVKPMQPDEFRVVIDYFHGASREFLERLGVDPTRLPESERWLETFAQDYERSPVSRKSYFLLWKERGLTIGFSSVNNISYGDEAYMHLHVVEPETRRSGVGLRAVRKSVPIYFEALKLQRLFCEPNAFNIAPNRTLQKAGFTYVKTYRTVPSPINYHQPVTRWVIHRDAIAEKGD